MSMVTSVTRYARKTRRFNKSPYAKLKSFDYKVIPTKELVFKKTKTDGEKRLLSNEFIVQKTPATIKIWADKPLTREIFTRLFHDVGFNVDVALHEGHNSDTGLVANIGGFVIPFWQEFWEFIFGKDWEFVRLLTLRIGPGKKRLHSRAFFNDDGSIYLVTHVDETNNFNFLDPKGLYHSHLQTGTGNYEAGTKIMLKLVKKIKRLLKQRRIPAIDIAGIYDEFQLTKSGTN